jgi:dTDP-4-dehydrorhamnose reductase
MTMIATAANDPEVWGGIECTVNRVGDRYMDQLELSGHTHRNGDLPLLAKLGIKKLRYPVLWERTAPQGTAAADWSWSDQRLKDLQRLGIVPIVGLVHHGSGPRQTQLDCDSFATGLAEFARAVAERYPWIEYYCPVNEPLTTARFSGLYGHWYPHGRDNFTFARALINQCRAVALAMQAIRKANPNARLVQTEDLAKVYSTPRLAYQAEFENERRWATFDLLTGKLGRDKPFWHFLCSAGMVPNELDWFQQHPCPPDILGCNHYVVGERFLDERLYYYPSARHGGNGRDRYVDVEAVRVPGVELAGWEGLLRETWDRYRLPLALTEVHLNCHREDQVQWFIDAWHTAKRLKSEGIDIQGVTAWKLFGSFNWNKLLTKDVNHYEPGVFELGGGRPRPTAISAVVRAAATGSIAAVPAIKRVGWWRHPSRFVYPPIFQPPNGAVMTHESSYESTGPPILIVGSRGTLGTAFTRVCQQRRLSYAACCRQDLDVTDRQSIARALQLHKPWAVINAAGYVRVDDAEHEPYGCYRANTLGAKNLARACATSNVQFLTFSSDLVFDGELGSPYVEEDFPGPLSVYGRSKAAAERRVLASFPDALVIRTSAFFSPWDSCNFLTCTLRQLTRGDPIRIAGDWIVSPTYLPDLVHRCLDLLFDGASGIWHLANEGTTSWADFAERAAKLANLNSRLIERCRGSDLGLAARRPRYSALSSVHGRLLPSLDSALEHFCTCNREDQRPVQATAFAQ